MNETLEANLNIIKQRWPAIFSQVLEANLNSLNIEVEQNTLLVNGIQLTSNYDRIAEAKIQAELIPMHSKVAYVYGLGLGDLPTVLLERNTIERVIVCLFNVDLLLHIINVIDLSELLSDERISLIGTGQFNELNKPFAAVPTELIFAQDNSASLRDKVVLALDEDFIQGRHRDENSWIASAINENIEYIKADPSIDELSFSSADKVIITAAGPTLDQHIEYLKNNQDRADSLVVIAVDASVKSLLKNNIIPDVVVSIDHSSYLIFEGFNFEPFINTAFVYFPRVRRDVLNAWQGQRYCSYPLGNSYKEVSQKFPKQKLFTSGSVIHPAVDLAVQKGAKEIILLGADFGFPNNQTYASGQKITGTEHYSDSSDWVLNGKGERISTMLNYRGYLRDLESYIASKPFVKFINGSLDGAKIAGTTLL